MEIPRDNHQQPFTADDMDVVLAALHVALHHATCWSENRIVELAGCQVVLNRYQKAPPVTKSGCVCSGHAHSTDPQLMRVAWLPGYCNACRCKQPPTTTRPRRVT